MSVSGGIAIATLVSAAILLICRICTPLFARVKQPSVVAELCVGIVLGLTAAKWSTALHIEFAMPDLKAVLYWTSEPTLFVYMLFLGYSIDLGRFKAELARSSSIALLALLVPFAIVYALLASHLPLGITAPSSVLGTLAICGAVTVTAMPVMARILDELKLIGTRVGTASISAAAIDDLFSWILLGILSAVVGGRAVQGKGLPTTIAIAGLCLAAIIILRLLLQRYSGARATATIAVATVALSVILARELNIDILLLSFAIGLSIPRIDAISAVVERSQGFVTRLMPLFFVLSGMKAADSGWYLALSAILIWVALATTKGAMAYVAARATRFDKCSALMVGALMNCRGVVSLIFLSVGLRNGLITEQTYTVLLMVALLTTFMTTPLVLAIQRFVANEKLTFLSERSGKALTEA